MHPGQIPNLLNRLKSINSSSTVRNPYHSIVCCRNLTAYLRALCSYPYSGHLLVGEAPGHKGCALTGIPFTSQRILATCEHRFLRIVRKGWSQADTESESTATIVWDHLEGCSIVPALWNAFPFHPHQAHNPRSNRRPTFSEVSSSKLFLELILDILTPHTIIAVGKTAAEAMRRQIPGQDVKTVRHPSHGGKLKFIEGLRDARIV